MKFVVFAALLIVALNASEFVPKEFAAPPNTKPEGVPPPLTELAEKEGWKEHLAYTNKLNSDVQAAQEADKAKAAEMAEKSKQLVKNTQEKAILSNNRSKLDAEKVENDDGNTAAAGIFMEDQIKKVKASAAAATAALDVVKKEADAKVQQAQADVNAKNDIISQKNTELTEAQERIKSEAAKAEQECEAKLTEMEQQAKDQMASAVANKEKEVEAANEGRAQAEQGTVDAKRKCGEDADAAKTQHESELAQKDTQIQTCKESLTQRDDALKQKDDEIAQKVQAAEATCTDEKAQVAEKEKGLCNVELNKVKGSLAQSQEESKGLNQKMVEVEQRATTEKQEAVQKAEDEKTQVQEACKTQIRDLTQQFATQEATSVKGAKDMLNIKLVQARDNVQKTKSAYEATIAQIRTNRDNKVGELRKENSELETQIDKQANKHRKLKASYSVLLQSVKDQAAAQKAAANAVNDIDLTSDIPTSEQAVAAVRMISNHQTLIYGSLITSAALLGALVWKLRGESVTYKKYSTLMDA